MDQLDSSKCRTITIACNRRFKAPSGDAITKRVHERSAVPPAGKKTLEIQVRQALHSQSSTCMTKQRRVMWCALRLGRKQSVGKPALSYASRARQILNLNLSADLGSLWCAFAGQQVGQPQRKCVSLKPLSVGLHNAATPSKMRSTVRKELAAEQVGGVYSVQLSKTSELHEKQRIDHVIMVR